jgi:DNA-binding LacI/PurR family transcriptional regulator
MTNRDESSAQGEGPRKKQQTTTRSRTVAANGSSRSISRRGDALTMADIARFAGVAQSTVSRVLNNNDSAFPIAPETRARVLDAAAKLGYRPNPAARALAGAPTMLLGVIVRDLGNPFFASALNVLAAEAMTNDYNLILGHAHGRSPRVTALTDILETRQTDAIILLGDLHGQPALVNDLKTSSIPVVATWQGISAVDFPTMDVDDRVGVRIALEHLFELGHERIALVSGSPLDNTIRERLYLQHMYDRSRGVPSDYVQHVTNSLEGGEAGVRALLDLAKPPSAILATTDVVALGVLYGAWSRGCVVGRDLSVVGYDDLFWSARAVPPLTTVRMPTEEIVRAAVRAAIDLARSRDKTASPTVTLFEPHLAVRSSTGLARP